MQKMTELLRKEIPLCDFMQMEVTALSDTTIEVSAPLPPNRNMHQTGFAGSLYALAVATGWGLTHHRQVQFGLSGILVVKIATMHYKRPVNGDIELRAEFSQELAEVNLADKLAVDGKVNLPLVIWIYSEKKKCACLEANYVLMPNKHNHSRKDF